MRTYNGSKFDLRSQYDNIFPEFEQDEHFEADAYFPEIRADEWKKVDEVKHGADEKHAHAFSFITYQRI